LFLNGAPEEFQTVDRLDRSQIDKIFGAQSYQDGDWSFGNRDLPIPARSIAGLASAGFWTVAACHSDSFSN